MATEIWPADGAWRNDAYRVIASDSDKANQPNFTTYDPDICEMSSARSKELFRGYSSFYEFAPDLSAGGTGSVEEKQYPEPSMTSGANIDPFEIGDISASRIASLYSGTVSRSPTYNIPISTTDRVLADVSKIGLGQTYH